MTPASSNFTESSRVPARVAHPGCFRRVLVNGLAIAAMLLCSDSILVLSVWCDSVLVFMTFSALVMCCLPPGGSLRRTIFALPHIAAMYALLRIETDLGRLVALCWLILSLEITGQALTPGEHRPGARTGLVDLYLAGLAYAIFLAFYSRGDAVWFAMRALSELMPATTRLGAWTLGIPVYMVGFLAGLSGLMTRGRNGAAAIRSAAGLLLLFVVFGGSVAAGGAIIGALAPIGNLHISLLHVVALIVVAVTLAGMRPGRPGRARAVVVSMLLMAGLLLMKLQHQPSPCELLAQPSCPSRMRHAAGLYSEGLLDWHVPDMRRLGLANSGMFGLFRRDLEAWMSPAGEQVLAGGESGACGTAAIMDSLSESSLAGLDLLVVINPSRCPTRPELALLEEFVREGNSLLVLGDHTDIGNSREPLNAILGFTGIRFNYDSAVPLRRSWLGCLELRGHTVTSGIKNPVMLQVGIGASLEIERRATPLIVARYGFADAGNPANRGRGGYMGNVVQEAGERVGGLVLAACEVIGEGRVLVFGDTSPFQNAALFLSRRLVRNSVEWLCPAVCSYDGQSGYESLTAGRPGAIVDFSLSPDVSLEPFSARSLGGLANCLSRSGVIPVPALEGSSWDEAAPLLFLINPTAALEAERAEWLLGHMMSGGNVILATGYAEPQPASPLLSTLGLAIQPVPLGGGDSTSAVSHGDAWSIADAGAEPARVLSCAFGYPTAVRRKVGSGSFTLIADSRLLLDEALEDEWGGDPGNIAFVTGLVEDLMTGRAERDTCAEKD